VLAAAREWAASAAEMHPDVIAVGCFGSYARGDAGVGSDLDLIIIVRDSDRPFMYRGAAWATERLPVPADLVVYTSAKWAALPAHAPRFAATLKQETLWLAGTPPGDTNTGA
jgi:predicted nucleotidyltransferase